MKKLIVLFVILAMVNVASAGVIDILITSMNGATLTTPVKEITLLNASDTVDFQITWTAAAGQNLFGINSNINVSGNGSLDYTHFTPWTRVWDDDLGDWVYTNVDISGSFDPTLHVLNTVDNPDWIVEGAKTWGVTGNGLEKMAVKNLYLHCDAGGDVAIWLSNHGNGSVSIDNTTHAIIPFTYGAGVIIHQPGVPEPMTLTLLGLGSLFLARRKK